MGDRTVIRRRITRARRTIHIYRWALVDTQRCFDLLLIAVTLTGIAAIIYLIATDWPA